MWKGIIQFSVFVLHSQCVCICFNEVFYRTLVIHAFVLTQRFYDLKKNLS